jgi:thioredoxin-like negative regulator of GroEL
LCTSAQCAALEVSNTTATTSPTVADDAHDVSAASQFHADASASYFRKKARAAEAQRADVQVDSQMAQQGTQGNGTASNETRGSGMARNGTTDAALAGGRLTGHATANQTARNNASGTVAVAVGTAPTAVSSPPTVDRIVGEPAFITAIGSDDLVFVKFFSPRCPHCRTMAPAYAAVAQRMQASKMPLRVMNVDCTEEPNRSMCETHVPAGYPTLKLFSKGEIVDEYTGVRDETSMMRWLEHAVDFRVLPRVEHLSSKVDLAMFLNKSDDRPIVLAAVTHATPSFLKDEWLAAVDVMRDTSAKTVAFATVPDWTYLVGDSGSNLNRMHQKTNVYNVNPFAVASPLGGLLGDNNTEAHWWFDGIAGADCLETFMHISTLPRFRAIMTPQNAPFLSATSRPLAILFGRTPGPGWVVERALRFLADAFPEILAIYASSTDLPGFRQHVGLDQLEPVSTYADYDHLDFVLFRAPSSGIEKIPRISKKRPSKKTMLQLTRKYLTWGVNMTERRSGDEPVPENDIVNHTARAFSTPREVVASSWTRIVERDGRAVLLLLYRDDCPTCKAELPVFEEACALLHSDARSVFCVRMNLDSNDLPLYMTSPHKVPATYMVVNGESPSQYQGPATASALATFARLASSPPHSQAAAAMVPHQQRMQEHDSTRLVSIFGTLLVGLGMSFILTGLFWRLRAARTQNMAPFVAASKLSLPRSSGASRPPRKLV